MTMVQQLSSVLPENYTAEPRVHLGSYFEIDVSAYEGAQATAPRTKAAAGTEAVSTATWVPPSPTLVVDAHLAEQYEYEVLIYDQDRGRTLVAAV